MKILFGCSILCGVACAGLALAQAPAPNGGGAPARPRPVQPIAPTLPIALAMDAVKASIASCSGFKVGVVILDQSGQIKLDYLPDGVAGFHSGMAFHKASTALLIKAPSEGLKDRVAADKDIADKFNAAPTTYVNLAGGLPIVMNGEVVGAIGVSGAEPSTKDESCSADGLKAVLK